MSARLWEAYFRAPEARLAPALDTVHRQRGRNQQLNAQSMKGLPTRRRSGKAGRIRKIGPARYKWLQHECRVRKQHMLGQLHRSVLQTPRTFSEVAPEVRPAVHTALLCLNQQGMICGGGAAGVTANYSS